MHVVEQQTITRGSLDSVTKVLPGEDRGVADQLFVDILLLLLLSLGRLARLLDHLGLLVGAAGLANTFQSLARNQEGVSRFRRSLPSGGGDNGDDDEQSPSGPEDTKVPPDMSMTVRQGF